MRRIAPLLLTAALLAGCSGGSNSFTPVTNSPPVVLPQSPSLSTQSVADLRYGFAPLPPDVAANGYTPSGDNKALIAPTYVSPATVPIPGKQMTGSLGPTERFVIRVPTAWNGKLVVVGTPGTRSEYSNDATWGDYILSKGYAFASSNKTISYNAVAESIGSTSAATTIYPIPFNIAGIETAGLGYRLGLLTQPKTSITDWNNDFASLIATTKQILASNFGAAPTRTYAVGLSNGGAQVRSILEQHPELVDGGVEWSAVYWSPQLNILTYLPQFITLMQPYIASGFTDMNAYNAIVNLGYPPDRHNGITGHTSLWMDYYSNTTSFYADLTVFEYALFLDPSASSLAIGACTPNATNPNNLPGTCPGSGLAIAANRAKYVPSQAALANIATFSMNGRISRPLTSIAGGADVFITPQNNETPYLNAVNAAGRGPYYHQYIVNGGTHVDAFAAYGYGLQAQAPFAWRAFDQMVDEVENGVTVPGAGTQTTVNTPTDIPVP